MRFTRGQWIAGFITLLLIVATIVINVATNNLPTTIRPYSWLSWPILIILILALVWLSMINVDKDNDDPSSDESILNDTVQVVCEAEEITSKDTALTKIDNWVETLAQWKEVGKSLIKISRVHKRFVGPKKIVERSAQLLIRLAKAIVPTMSQRGQRNDLIELAIPAYAAAMFLKKWDDASELAYETAQTYYTLGRYKEAEMWVDQMEKSLKNMSLHQSFDMLQSKFLDMKGLIVRYYFGKPDEARELFQQALILSTRLSNPFMIWQVTTHLGKVEELDGQLDKAVMHYTEALEGATILEKENPDLKLNCYEELGRLAIAEGRYSDAQRTYTQQLQLSIKYCRPIFEGHAHAALAKVLLKETACDYKEAYQHARKALEIERLTTGNNEDELRNLVIKIADKSLLMS